MAPTAGALFGKATHSSEEVHQAMIARGYRGDARTLDRFRIAALDIAVLAAAAVAMLLLIGGDRAIG